MSQPTTFPRYRIIASRADGSTLECFTWTRSPASGIAHAKREAFAFGHTDLTDFKAVEIEEAR